MRFVEEISYVRSLDCPPLGRSPSNGSVKGAEEKIVNVLHYFELFCLFDFCLFVCFGCTARHVGDLSSPIRD